ALTQYGIHNVVATLGTATSVEHILRLFSITQEVIFCFDGDQAGQTAAWRALITSLPSLQDGWTLRFLFLPEGEDPDSWIRKQGTENFIKLLPQTLSLADFLFQHLLEQADISSLEGKAKLAQLAAPLLKKIPESVMQHKLFERLASLIGME